MKKLTALFLFLCLLTTVLGCSGTTAAKMRQPAGESAPRETPEVELLAASAEEETAPADQTDSVEETATPTGETETTPAPTAEPLVGDLAAIYAKYDPETVVATVDGEDMTWLEYHYYLNNFVQYMQYIALQNGITLTDWNANDFDANYTNSELVLLNSEAAFLEYHAVAAMAKERGVTLSEADEERVLSIFEQNADSTSGDGDGECTEEEAEAFETYLTEQFIDRDFFNYLNEMGVLSSNMFAAEFGEGGEEYSDEDTLAYADSVGIHAAKHILLLTQDMTTGESLSEEEIEEKRAKAEEIQAQLAAEDDPDALNALFDELMEENTEDTGYSSYPDGYTYIPGVMISAFEGAVSALPVGGISQVVETDYGFHVIMRIAVQPDAVVMVTNGQSVNLRTAAAQDAFSQEISAAKDNVDVQWAEGFENIDIGELFGPDA